MKLILLLAAVACSFAAKLDRTYLPPSHAQTSGGSGSFLDTPHPSNQRINGFSRGSNYAASPAEFNQNDYYAQGRNTIAQTGNNYPSSDYALNYDGNVNGNYNYDTRPARPQSALERSAAILRQDNQNDGDTYSFAYETENGIYAEENGVATNGVEAQGGYTYTGDDGQLYSIRYTAGQNGFVPEGDHLPTPPPVPEEILKALEQNARDEAAGIYDDGSYAEGKYGDDGGYASNNQAMNNQYNNVNNRYLPPNNGNRYTNDEDDTVVTNSARYMPEAAQNFRRISGIANQGSGYTGATRAYLPPTESQRGFGRSAQRNFGPRRQPSYNARTGYQY